MAMLAHIGGVPVEELAFAAPSMLLAAGALWARVGVWRGRRRDG